MRLPLCWLAALSVGSAWPLSLEQLQPQHRQLIDRLTHTLVLVLRQHSANRSIFINTDFSSLKPAQLIIVQLAVTQALQRLEVMPPIVHGDQLDSREDLYVHMQLLFAQTAEHLITLDRFRQQTKYLLVLLTAAPPQQQQSNMTAIFGHFLRTRYILDVLLLLAHTGKATVRAYTYYPYTRERCESSTPVLVSSAQLRFGNAYPGKLHNLYGCPLSVVVWPIPPFMELNWQAADVAARISGLDATILKTVAAKLNFKLMLLPNEPSWLIGGAIHHNGSMSGAYKMIYERRANLTLGCAACTPARSKFLSRTQPYYYVQYVIVLRSTQRYTSYEIMLLPFDGYTWLLLICLFALHLLLQRYVRLALPPLLRRPLRSGWLLLLFVLRSSYESSVFEFVHNSPAKPLPLTIDELLKQRYDIIADHATFRMTDSLPTLAKVTRQLPGQPIDMFEALALLPERTSVLTSKHFLAHHVARQQQQRRGNFVMLQQQIVDSMFCMYFPRDSFLEPVINTQLLHMRSFGLFNRFSKRLDLAKLSTTTVTRKHAAPLARFAATNDFAQSMHFLRAALNCLLIAHAGAFCIFVLELLSQRLGWRAATFQCN